MEFEFFHLYFPPNKYIAVVSKGGFRRFLFLVVLKSISDKRHLFSRFFFSFFFLEMQKTKIPTHTYSKRKSAMICFKMFFSWPWRSIPNSNRSPIIDFCIKQQIIVCKNFSHNYRKGMEVCRFLFFWLITFWRMPKRPIRILENCHSISWNTE